MSEKEIITNLVKELGHFMSNRELSVIASRITGKSYDWSKISKIKHKLGIFPGRGKRQLDKDLKIGLDLYDHRVDKSGNA